MIRVENIVLLLENKVICRIPFLLEPGKMTCVCGESGSGKSTLLYLLGLLDDTDSCVYRFNEQTIELKSEEEKAYYRRYHIGYVFQD